MTPEQKEKKTKQAKDVLYITYLCVAILAFSFTAYIGYKRINK